MKVVCIDDTNRPIDIPESKWVKKDEIYTIVKVVKLNKVKQNIINKLSFSNICLFLNELCALIFLC